MLIAGRKGITPEEPGPEAAMSPLRFAALLASLVERVL
jgi:hypothetical protein